MQVLPCNPCQSALTTTKSYAQAISSPIVPVFFALKRKDNYIAIKMNPIAYEKRLKLYNQSLIGWVFLLKGKEP